MSKIEMRLECKNLPAKTALDGAKRLLDVLNAIERDITGKRRATIKWSVNIHSTLSDVVITFTHIGEVNESIIFETNQALLERMKQE